MAKHLSISVIGNSFPRPLLWVLLLFFSGLAAIGLTLLHLPAGWLLGPIVVGIIFSALGISLKVPKMSSWLSQSLMGVLIAQALTMDVLQELLLEWPVFLVVILSVMILSWGLGLILALLKVVPPREAIWGSSPGAAGAMVIMAQSFDADARLVALMQYTRLLLVILAASLVTFIWIGNPGISSGADIFSGWLQFPDTLTLTQTLALTLGGVLFALTRLPAAALLMPMFLGVLLNVSGVISIMVPEPFAVFCYLIIGWEVGLGFDREALQSSLKVFPRIVISNLLLIILCGGLAYLVSSRFSIDPLSAYLATSPGGANTVAVIAMTSPVNAPFIMSLQVCRMVSLVIFGPVIARALAKRIN